MNGLSIAKGYFEEYGLPMLKEQFPEVLPHLAAGLCGSGSQCFGYDDAISQDHDFAPGFLLFLPGEDLVDRRTAFQLERAYAKLPKEYAGITRDPLAASGLTRYGVLRIEEFMMDKTGTPDGILSTEDWLRLPSQSLAEAVNGALFYDGSGQMTRIRAALSRYPEDIKKKKLAGHLLMMAQAGQYNYLRCLARGETGAAQLTAIRFAEHTMSSVFLLNDTYEPYYKWSFHAMRALPKFSLHAELLEYLITTDNEKETAEEKYSVMEGIASDIIEVLIDEGLTKANCGDLEKHAYSVNDDIQNPTLRNLHILAGIPG